MKTQLIFCIPLYLFTLVCVITLLYYFIPVLVNLIKMIPQRVINISLAGFLTISVLYCIIVTFI